jgi:hypothetical protein
MPNRKYCSRDPNLDVKLIEEVERYPQIYDLSHRLHYDHIDKARCWNLIANKLQASGKLTIIIYCNL